MLSSESTSDSDSSASKKTTISVEQITELITESNINHDTSTKTSTTTATSATRTTGTESPPSKSTTSSPTPTSPTPKSPTSKSVAPSKTNATETPATNAPADRGDIGSYIDDLIRKNEAIVENCPLTNIRPYKQSASKVGDCDPAAITSAPTTSSSFNQKTSFSLSENDTATLSQIIMGNNAGLQRNLSTTSSSSSSSSSTAPNHKTSQQAKQASISHLMSNISNITTTAPSKRKSTPCLVTPTNLPNSSIGPFSSHVNQAQNPSSTAAASVAAAAAYGLIQKAANLRSISEHRGPQQSSLFTNNNKNDNQFQISQHHHHRHHHQQQQQQHANQNHHNNNSNNWPCKSGSDYPSDSTGYSSAGSLSHQSSICDTTIFSNTTQTNPLPTSISAFIAQSLPSLSAAISAVAASASIVTPPTPSYSSSGITPANNSSNNNNNINNNSSDNNKHHAKTTSLSSPCSSQSAEPRSRKRSYEVRNRDIFFDNNIQQQALPTSSSSSASSNRFSSNMLASMIANTSQVNSSNPAQLFNFSQLLEEQQQSINFAIRQQQQQQQQALDTDSTEFKMALIKEKMAALSRQQSSLQLELEEEERKHEQQQLQQHQQQLQNQQDHINNLSALVNGDNQYLLHLRQELQRQLPTTEHSAELLTQSLDSATPAYKCQLCNMSFWTKALLNYHHTTQCPSIINILGLNLAHQQQQQQHQQQEQNQMQNNTREVLSLHQQLQQLEMTGDLRHGEISGSVSPSRQRQPFISKSASPRVKSHVLTPDSSILNASHMQQRKQQYHQDQANRLQHQQEQHQYPYLSGNLHNHYDALRQPSIRIEQPDNDFSSNEFLNRSLSPIGSSSNSNPKYRNRNNSEVARLCDNDNIVNNESVIINATSTLTPTTSSSSSLSLGSDTGGCHQLRSNSASITSTINNGVSIGTSNDDNNGNNNLALANNLPLKKRKISAPGFI